MNPQRPLAPKKHLADPETAGRPRRDFLKAAAAGSMALSSLSQRVHAGVDETLKVGLVGCGGRGIGAAIEALTADKDTRLVAMADTFPDRAASALEQLRLMEAVVPQIAIEADNVFHDFDGYRSVVDRCDVVLLATPPHFRPEHFEYAVKKGKHVFVEKPVAVDVPGVKRVMESCRLAREKNLAVVSGLCWRYDLAVRETMRQILEERMIGDIVAIRSQYNAGTLWHRGDKPEWSRMEYQIRNWLYHTWLSGDHIMEQAIHSLDKTAWLLGDASPTKAMGIGGRQQRVDSKWGDIYDHFTVFFEYASGPQVFFTCRQQDGTTNEVDEVVLGTQGKAQILRNRISKADGTKWKYEGPKPSMYQVEHDHLFRSIRAGQPIHNGDYMCNSTLIAMMGRMAAYTGKTITWEQLMASTERLGPQEYTWGSAPDSNVPMPGVYSMG